METKRKHVPTWLYKLAAGLINSMKKSCLPCPTSTPLTQGKSDKASGTLAWLPDVEKFSKEIGKQQAYIDSLKRELGRNPTMQGVCVMKSTSRNKGAESQPEIFELQRTNEQMGRLLSKIPPEVLEELQKHRSSERKVNVNEETGF